MHAWACTELSDVKIFVQQPAAGFTRAAHKSKIRERGHPDAKGEMPVHAEAGVSGKKMRERWWGWQHSKTGRKGHRRKHIDGRGAPGHEPSARPSQQCSGEARMEGEQAFTK